VEKLKQGGSKGKKPRTKRRPSHTELERTDWRPKSGGSKIGGREVKKGRGGLGC